MAASPTRTLFVQRMSRWDGERDRVEDLVKHKALEWMEKTLSLDVKTDLWGREDLVQQLFSSGAALRNMSRSEVKQSIEDTIVAEATAALTNRGISFERDLYADRGLLLHMYHDHNTWSKSDEELRQLAKSWLWEEAQLYFHEVGYNQTDNIDSATLLSIFVKRKHDFAECESLLCHDESMDGTEITLLEMN